MNTPPNVHVIAYDGLCTFEFGVAYEVFGLPRPEAGPGWYRFTVCAAEDRPLRAAGGLSVSVDAGLDALDEADLIVIPGWRGLSEPVPQRLTDALRKQHGRGARLMSLCSGAVVLAEAGILDGRRATTHWRYLPALKDRFPNIRFVEDTLYVDEGDILTAAGSAAGIDLCLHVVRRDFGAELANGVARRLVVPPHRDGGQAQFVASPVPSAHESGRLGPVFDWIRQNLGDPIKVDGLARKAGMSERTFHRRVIGATGLSPGAWILQERLRAAQLLLETQPHRPLEDVSLACGFGSADSLRRQFRARFGVTPSSYRRRFGGPPAEGRGGLAGLASQDQPPGE
ncbi:transcriptional regulator FtrA [Stappia sp.]|uniref:transcriptional regulator FtrA n=1 Tax=Stappia sp. TaxID=1870903 RepID=UPI003A9A5CAA